MERATAEIHEEFDGLLKDRKRKFALVERKRALASVAD